MEQNESGYSMKPKALNTETKKWTKSLFYGLSQCVTRKVFLATMLLFSTQLVFAESSLNFISFTSLSDEAVELHLTFSGPPPEPEASATENPTRLTFDLAGVEHNLPWSLPLPIEVGAADTISAVEASGRTRVVVNLNSMVGYETKFRETVFILP